MAVHITWPTGNISSLNRMDSGACRWLTHHIFISYRPGFIGHLLDSLSSLSVDSMRISLYSFVGEHVDTLNHVTCASKCFHAFCFFFID